MRLIEQLAQRSRLSKNIEPLPHEELQIDFEKDFRITRSNGMKRKALRAVSPYALAALQPWIRRRIGGISSPVGNSLWSWGERFAWDYVNNQLNSLIAASQCDVLIQGCWLGDSSVQAWLARGAHSVAGIELYNLASGWEKSVPILKDLYHRPLTLCQGSVDSIPFPNETFDVVESSAVYEHVFNLEMAMKESARVLKPNGYAIHSIGPLYFTYSGDHCCGSLGYKEGYAHLLDDEMSYRQKIRPEAFIGTSDPNMYQWASWDKFSYARISDYQTAWEPHFDVSRCVLVVSPKAVAYRRDYPAQYQAMKDAGLIDLDLLVTSIKVLLRKRKA